MSYAKRHFQMRDDILKHAHGRPHSNTWVLLKIRHRHRGPAVVYGRTK